MPNKFLRISPDGRVSYSQRLTIHARCRMHLLKFPLDSQICPLWISSYGYASRYVYLPRSKTLFYTLYSFFNSQLPDKLTNNAHICFFTRRNNWYTLILVRLWNFKDGGSKKVRVFAKNQYTQRKPLYIENTGSTS